MKLGKREVDGLVCPDGRKDLMVFDDELRGFGVRVTAATARRPGGLKVFLFQYRRGAKIRRLRLGDYGAITVAQARKLAELARAEVGAGRDPVAEREAAIGAETEADATRKRLAEADAFTLDRLIDAWAEGQLRHRSARYRAEAVRALRFGLKGLAAHPAHAIDTAAVQRALLAIPKRRQSRPAVPALAGPKSREKPPPPAAPPVGIGADATPIAGAAMARRTHSYGRAMFGWAVRRGLVPSNPFTAAMVDGREVSRERTLTDAQLGEVWRAAGGLCWPWGPFLQFLLLTLQREAETAGLRWAELSSDGAVWELPGARTKNRRAHLVHLAEPARAILAAVPRRAESALVFTTTGSTAISGFSHAKLRLDAAIMAARAEAAAAQGRRPEPLAPWRLHDFRRTGVTALARLDVRWEVCDKVLNHTGGAIHGVAAVYQRHDYLAERKAALDIWAAHVLAVGK